MLHVIEVKSSPFPSPLLPLPAPGVLLVRISSRCKTNIKKNTVIKKICGRTMCNSAVMVFALRDDFVDILH